MRREGTWDEEGRVVYATVIGTSQEWATWGEGGSESVVIWEKDHRCAGNGGSGYKGLRNGWEEKEGVGWTARSR